jgi:hypothetical protein
MMYSHYTTGSKICEEMVKRVFLSWVVFLVLALETGWAQNKFSAIENFKDPAGNWFEAGDAKLNPDDEKKLTAIDGTGVLISEHGKTANLVTKQNYGDVKLELDFMMSKNSNSGVYLQGRYEIQIYDSWGKTDPDTWDCGGIYERYDGTKTYEGTPPMVNASKKPGEWQHLEINFKAPRFNSKGDKIKNAVFKKVKLNGITIHKNAEVSGPTASSLDEKEEPSGPLMLQGDHGPVAYRNIKLKSR